MSYTLCLNMEDDTLTLLLNEAHANRKYVWLKHSFDPNPLYGIFAFNESSRIYVRPYFSSIDGYEGCLSLRCIDVQWAHISDQTYFPDMEKVLAEAVLRQSLIRIRFSDQSSELLYFTNHTTSKEWIFSDGPFSESEDHCVLVVNGYFVDFKVFHIIPSVTP